MSNGVFGSIIPADIDIENDVDIFYCYKPNRGDDGDNGGFKTLSPSACLVQSEDENENKIEGLYSLRLPLKDFNKSGIYTIYIKPKEINATVKSVGFLAAYPDVSGIVLVAKDGLGADLIGYRIKFEAENGKKYTKIIRSSDYCKSAGNDGGYNLTSQSTTNLIFCTVTPSTSIWPESDDDSVILCNTKFAPKVIEVEITEHDIETISYMLEGNQINNRDTGVLTTLNDNNEVYHQAEYYTLKDGLGNPLYTVKKKINKASEDDVDNILNAR